VDAARLVGRKLNRSAATPFFAIAIEARPNECGSLYGSRPHGRVIAALGRPPDWMKAKASEALTEACWNTLALRSRRSRARLATATTWAMLPTLSGATL